MKSQADTSEKTERVLATQLKQQHVFRVAIMEKARLRDLSKNMQKIWCLLLRVGAGSRTSRITICSTILRWVVRLQLQIILLLKISYSSQWLQITHWSKCLISMKEACSGSIHPDTLSLPWKRTWQLCLRLPKTNAPCSWEAMLLGTTI